ncbi:MAG: hypothetical protein KatS3mg108_1724 [Isosphaeraceae bacterium]|jgi:flavin reductase (DIM6/NTAB) family NADH-FMN oxidoreductase RutF|nr:MAG: hypothetical protein KatS3mg108_1724 [Isosphaeraceae bacterium]
MTSIAHHTQAARAVGRIPSGLFVLGLTTGSARQGVLVSWVQQAGFEPLMVSVAVRADRPIQAALKRGTRFVLNQLAEGQSDLVRRFARSSPGRLDDFEGLELAREPRVEGWSGPVLADALAALHLEVVAVVQEGDHALVLGRVLDGVVHNGQAEPLVHLRKSGAHY